MENNAVVKLLADAYGLSRQQEEMLSNYNEVALEYAVKEFVKQNKERTINSPVNWIASVAGSYQLKEQQSKTGRTKQYNNAYASKIVEGRFNSNHSPMRDQSNMTMYERKQFAANEVSKWQDIVDRGEGSKGALDNWKHLAKDPREWPSNINSFKEDEHIMYHYGKDDPDLEEHLNKISADKSDPEGYKLMMRKFLYRRTARK